MEPLRILAVASHCREARHLLDLATSRRHDVVSEPGDGSFATADVLVVDLTEDRDPNEVLERARASLDGQDMTLVAVCTPEQAIRAAAAGADEVVLSGSDDRVLEARFELLERRVREARARARTRAQLQKSHADLSALVENTTDYVLFSDTEGNPVFFNSAYAGIIRDLLGIEMRPGLKPHELLMDPETRALWDSYHRRVLSGERFSVEYEHPTRDGSCLTLEVHYSPVIVDGRIVGFSEFTRNVSEQKRAANVLRAANERLEHKVRERTADLEQRNRELQAEIETRRRAERARQAMEQRLRLAEKLEALGQLAGGIAHDFNNQLVGVLGGAEVLLQLSLDPEAVECAEMIRESALQSSELIKRLLEFARRGPTRAEPLDLHQVVRDARALLTRSLGPTVALVTKFESLSPTVRGDEALLQHALLNLVLNARDALPTGGTVTIATSDVVLDEEEARSLGSSAGRYVRLAVSDDGVGMDEVTRERLFEPFYTTKAEGTGLGLSVVYGTIQRHAGTIKVESTLGQGATFEFLLPVADGLPRDRSSSTSAARRSGRVLVVDDEPHVRRAVAAMLRNLGHSVTSCADGESAVDWVRDHPDGLDVVLLDVVMPGLGGIRAHAAIRALAPALPVVLMSGFAADGEVEKALADGARAFLSKPFPARELTRMLDDCLCPD